MTSNGQKSTAKGEDANKRRLSGRGGISLPSLVSVVGTALLAASFAYHTTQQQATSIPYDVHDHAARTEAILKSTPLIDGHNDLPFLLRLELHNQIYDNKTFSFRDGELLL